MQKQEFDKFASEYQALHRQNIRASGEEPEFFAEYKVKDITRCLGSVARDQLRVLDFGAGTGNSIPYLLRYLPSSQLTCLDVSKKSLAIAEKRYLGKADFIHFDGHRISFDDNTFDVAFAACVFHHIAPNQHISLLNEIHRVLKPHGKMFLFEHNPLNPLTVHAVNSCPFDENAILMRATTVKNRMRSAGFLSLDHEYRIFFPRLLRTLRPLERYLAWLPLGAQYFVVGKKLRHE